MYSIEIINMKQVNFKSLNVETEIDTFQEVDLRHEIGNALHRMAETVPMSELARRIYHSDDATDISNEDYSEMVRLLRTVFKRFVLDAIERSTTDKE